MIYTKNQIKKCPHCNRVFAAVTEDDYVDYSEHKTYCNPAHKRAEYGEEFQHERITIRSNRISRL